jgi:dipeptidyl aminopeptidase/acylaminoacyl peptidase
MRTVFLLTLFLLAAAPSFAAEPQPAQVPVPLAAFFDNPRMGGAKLSPDGKRLAMLVNSNTGHDRLGVVTLSDNSIKVVAQFSDTDIGHFEWVNNDRLLYDTRDKETPFGEQRYAPGLFAVNADGSAYRQLVDVNQRPFVSERSLARPRLPWNTFMLDQRGPQDSDQVYVTTIQYGHDRNPERADLLRLDTVTGRFETVPGPGPAREWWLDAGGRPALAATLEGNLETLHYLDPKDGHWRALATRDAYLGGKNDFTPLAFAPDGTLYVVSDEGRDKAALFAYDLAGAKLAAAPLVALDEYDFNGELVVGSGKLLGIHYTIDADGATWFDPGMRAAQEAVDKLLPGQINTLSVGVRSETPFVLVASRSDRQPLVYWLFNRESGDITRIGTSRPAIVPAQMAQLDLVHVKARDGLQIPAWLTVPNGGKGKKLPMVVLVHGGPYVRGREWQWNADSQFLASRGYVVLEPEYRGSTGYGAAHFRAGWKQWGLAMQDDVADATRWAVNQGIADPQRICIAGASYGGYATLMGLVRNPDLYKCGIDWVGVTDIELLYTGHWSATSDMSEAYKRYGMPTLVGDPVKDAAQFAATSPLKQAARITQPLLLAYGGADERVPIYHGRKFYDAVKGTNKQVEWVVYLEEGHGWQLVETRLDFWGRVEKFLARHIGKEAQP